LATIERWPMRASWATPMPGGPRRYIAAGHKGILKVLSKMGISTLQSYRGPRSSSAWAWTRR
jgi:hypothetical protein